MGTPVKTEPRMTAEEFMAWYETQPDGKRYELMGGHVYGRGEEMQGGRLAHVRVKMRVTRALENQISLRKLQCEALVDGMAIRVDDYTIFEPDALVRCGPDLPEDTLVLTDVLIVVEVVSPSSQRIDALYKLRHYFRSPSIEHYLILIPAEKYAIHHRRHPNGKIDTHICSTGVMRFDPPGIELDINEIFAVVN